jgi:hypothetical protein
MEILVGHSMGMFNKIHMLNMACKLSSGCREQGATYSKRETSDKRSTIFLYTARDTLFLGCSDMFCSSFRGLAGLH